MIRALLSVALCFAILITDLMAKNIDGGPVPVAIEYNEQADRYQVHRDDEPYFIKGVGGARDLEKLASMGANSVRTWSTSDAGEILDEAYEHGLTVMLGIWLEHERHGFDYDDEEAVQAQKEEVREKILRYKDHPALLAWGLGNEVDLMYQNTRVWHAVEDIAQMVKELDPNHLITTVTAGIDEEKAVLIQEKVPSIDFLSVNTYADLPELPNTIREIGWDKPYVVTEWGPTGHWESPTTEWDVPIEETSSEKAEVYYHRYKTAIEEDREMCLGSYAFLWGQKQETTPTWYGMFLENDYLTEVADVMQYLWSGEWPESRAPSIDQFTIEGMKAIDNIYLESGEIFEAKVVASHPQNNTAFQIEWEFLPESTDIGAGGDSEERPETMYSLSQEESDEGILKFMAPEESGPYRLFVYILHENNKAATANIPFYVQ